MNLLKLFHKIQDARKLLGLERLYCYHCDKREIDPERPISGSFYTIHGHELRCYPMGKFPRELGNYVEIVIALCTDCEKELEAEK